jgi:Tfp pilus assembly protein PilF
MSRIEKIKEMLKDSPKDGFLRHALALEYIKIDQKNEALDLFVNLLADDPAYLGSYYHLGKLYESLGEPSKAGATYAEGIALARKKGDKHSLSELMMAADDLD